VTYFRPKSGTIKSTKPEASQMKVMSYIRTNISETGKCILPQRQYYSVLERSVNLMWLMHTSIISLLPVE